MTELQKMGGFVMDAIKFFKEKERMFKFYGAHGGNSCMGVSCTTCPFNEGDKVGCLANDMRAIEIVEKWVKEHPAKTYKQDFLEKYPNARLTEDNFPVACLIDLGYMNFDCEGISCKDCWDMYME